MKIFIFSPKKDRIEKVLNNFKIKPSKNKDNNEKVAPLILRHSILFQVKHYPILESLVIHLLDLEDRPKKNGEYLQFTYKPRKNSKFYTPFGGYE